MGISASIPFLLQSNYRVGGYNLQATFSASLWPFGMKLLWAPVVDSLYIEFIGRRKTWVIITQYAIGTMLLILASCINEWFGRDPDKAWSHLGSHHPVDIIRLTIMFFILTFLTATQDIAVDGWALTMLSKKNIGWASTCNKVGQSLGYALAFIPLVCLESPDIPNKYFRRTSVEDMGLITFSGFLYVSGFIFMIFSTIVMIFINEKGSKLDKTIRHFVKSCLCSRIKWILCRSYSLKIEQAVYMNEKPIYAFNQSSVEADDGMRNSKLSTLNCMEENLPNAEGDIISESNEYELAGRRTLSIFSTYKALVGVIQLKSVTIYIVMTVIVVICAYCISSVKDLKLIEQGFPKEELALFNLVFVPLDFILPLMFVRCTVGPRPLTILVMTFIPKLLVNCLFILITHFTPYFRISTNDTLLMNNSSHSSFSWIFYAILATGFTLYKITSNLMFVLHFAFSAKISDPAIGGTYMTLMATVTNLAGGLGSTICLALVEPLTIRSCEKNGIHFGLHSNSSEILINELPNSKNTTFNGNKDCTNITESCEKLFDGYYIELIAFLIIGIASFVCFLYPKAKYLESLPVSEFTYDPNDRLCCSNYKLTVCRKLNKDNEIINDDNDNNHNDDINYFQKSNL
ncbi:putative membrane protein [Schistosoma japonicum]|uniref:Putative membrane protein n=1 Tax=Schistosoma japonicum TaxID=6182 RepID=A0A4Z2D334_SCHJA|nr:putative membrane protein [Schistosoma japonicum]